MHNLQPHCLGANSPCLDQEPAGSNKRPKNKRTLGENSADTKSKLILRKYRPNFIQSALDLFRDQEYTLKPILRLSHGQRTGIARLFRDCPKELGAFLDISAEDESFVEDFKDYRESDIQNILGQSDNRVGTLHDPSASMNKRLQTYPLSGQQSPRLMNAHPWSSSISFSTPVPPSGLLSARQRNPSHSFGCTYSCGKGFKKEGHWKKHELSHHNEKRKIACRHDGCEAEANTEAAYRVHHNKKHKLCIMSASCRGSSNYLRPPKTASSCGYCGMLFQGELNFEARGNHITQDHHKANDSKDRRTTKEWSRNVQLEGVHNEGGMFSRRELAGWTRFKEEQARLHGDFDLCWEKVPRIQWERLLEMVEHGSVIDDSPQWGFPANLVQNIFEVAYDLAVLLSSRSTSLASTERVSYDDVETSAQHLNSEMSHENVRSEHLSNNRKSTSDRHLWLLSDNEDPCKHCQDNSSVNYSCSKCNSKACSICIVLNIHPCIGLDEWDTYFSYLDYEYAQIEGQT